MPGFRYIFDQTILAAFFLFALTGCDDIPRDNPLDPKNPASYRSQIVFVEAFVNTNQVLADTLPFNQFMLSALDQFKSRHENKVVIAEYHRGSYADSLMRPEFDLLYNQYISGLGSTLKGVPDIFINGITGRITGASSVETALTRLETAFEPFSVSISEFTLESGIKISDSQVDIRVEVAKLGDSDAEDIVIKAVLIEDIQLPYLHRVARKIWDPELIPSLPNGETKTISFSAIPVKRNADRFIIFTVSSEDELQIYQTIEVALDE